MTNEEQEIAIAQACGWKVYWEGKVAYLSTADHADWGLREGFPRYLTDLNAMHAAEKLLVTDWRKYSDRLMRIVQVENHLYDDSIGARYRTAHATAAQKAEALLRYLGLWKTNEADVRPNTEVSDRP